LLNIIYPIYEKNTAEQTILLYDKNGTEIEKVDLSGLFNQFQQENKGLNELGVFQIMGYKDSEYIRELTTIVTSELNALNTSGSTNAAGIATASDIATADIDNTDNLNNSFQSDSTDLENSLIDDDLGEVNIDKDQTPNNDVRNQLDSNTGRQSPQIPVYGGSKKRKRSKSKNTKTIKNKNNTKNNTKTKNKKKSIKKIKRKRRNQKNTIKK
jgi:hypothetical protein